MKSFKILKRLLAQADIGINRGRPWDLIIPDLSVCDEILHGDSSLEIGEANMYEKVTCRAWDQFYDRILRAKLQDQANIGLWTKVEVFLAHIFNQQNIKKAAGSAQYHYDKGNSLYKPMLGKTMAYTCGYWKNASSLDEAQEYKFDLVCCKLHLKPLIPGQAPKRKKKILDIGCGYATFLIYAVQHYDVIGVGITLSPEQLSFAHELCVGLPIELRLQDYREVNEKFDCIVSLGMFEHVGVKNYRTFMEIADQCLENDGLFLLHTIGGNKSEVTGDPWIDKYIFPNSMLPSIKQIGEAIEGLFVMEDWHNFGADYDKTLMAWHANFVKHWDEIKDQYDETFYRMWTYYLLMCAGLFRSRHKQLWQIVLSKMGVPGGYESVR